MIGKKDKGFSLLEVMVALTIFATFITSYITSEGYNIADSTLLKKELTLEKLCHDKIREINLKPPTFEESLTLVPQTGNFDEKGYPTYEFTIEYKRLKIPDLNQIEGKEESNEGEASTEDGASQNEAARKKVFQIMKKNFEEMLWQVRVTVKEKGTDFPFSLSTLLPNSKAKAQVDF